MSTKLDPGQYDCYKKLADDEPYFLLRAKDPHGPAIVELWAALREAEFGPSAKFLEARACAQEMREWFTAHNGVPLSKRQALAASPQAGAQREGGQRERLIAIQLEHETKYQQYPSGAWGWECACGIEDQFTSRDDCHKRTREHWADVILRVLASPPSGEPGPVVAGTSDIALAHSAFLKGGATMFDNKPAPLPSKQDSGEHGAESKVTSAESPARASVESGERLRAFET